MFHLSQLFLIMLLMVACDSSCFVDAAATSQPTTAPASDTHASVSATVNGHDVKLTDDEQRQVVVLAKSLLESSSIDSTGDSDSDGWRWKRYESKPHFLIAFGERQRIQFSNGSKIATVEAAGILIPVSQDHLPDYVLVRSNPGWHAYCKYTPTSAIALQEIMKTLKGR